MTFLSLQTETLTGTSSSKTHMSQVGLVTTTANLAHWSPGETRTLRPAKGLPHTLFRPRRHAEPLQANSILKRPRDHSQQFLEGREVLPLHTSLDRRLHQMIPWNERRVHKPHAGRALRRGHILQGQPL